LRVLVAHLPENSTTVRLHRGHNWVDTNYQLADLFDVVNHLIAVTVTAPGKRVRSVKPYTRPEVAQAEAEHREKTSEAAIAYIESYRAAKEA